ncbi:MAG: OmpA family protein [Elusimicrobiaceae bacterium]|nr:OmpA family protein [Elusimicrobiaceae bacterium]
MTRNLILNTALSAAVSLFCAACASQKAKPASAPQAVKSAADAVPAADIKIASMTISGPDVSALRNYVAHDTPELKTVQFGFDSDALTAAAMDTLAGNAKWLKEHKETAVQVAGNCDQRGTIEYNIALGQRRAEVVKKYYYYMGIVPERVITISYGKEKPLCRNTSETCWMKNRRAETLKLLPPAQAE